MTIEHIFEAVIAVLVTALGALIWFVRLEGRVNLIERVMTDWIGERREVMKQVITHMERVEAKVDKIALRCAAFTRLHELSAGVVEPIIETEPE